MAAANTKLHDVLARCEETASWFEIRITDLHQRNHLGDTPLHTVCTWGDVEAVKELLRNGADPNALGDRGCTPLFNAVMGENGEVVQTLLAAGSDPRIRSVDGRLVIEYAKNVGSPPAVLKVLGYPEKSPQGKSRR